MGDPEQSLLYDQRDPEAEGRLETGQDSDGLGLPSAGYESLPSGGSAYQDLGDGKLGFEDQEEETLPEEVAGDEFLDAQDPGEAVPELERVLRRDEEDEAPETRCACAGGGGRGSSTPCTPGPVAWRSPLRPGSPGTHVSSSGTRVRQGGQHPRWRRRQSQQTTPPGPQAGRGGKPCRRAGLESEGAQAPELGGPGGGPRPDTQEKKRGSPSWAARPPEPHASPRK